MDVVNVVGAVEGAQTSDVSNQPQVNLVREVASSSSG
jgi:hypothetical protein